MISLKFKAAVLFVVFVGFAACGYRFTGGGDLPEGVSNVNIPLFQNRTSETGIEQTFTNDLIFEFLRAGRSVQKDRNKADAILNGVIKTFRVDSASRKGTITTAERRVTISVDLELLAPDGRIIWNRNGLRANETYDVASDRLAEERNQQEAIDALSKRLAERIYISLTDDF